jgi:ubiquinone/menaquinone biosynthesis C-methylase UbiE
MGSQARDSMNFATMLSHEQAVLSQFDAKAHAYLTSAVHAAGPDLERARQIFQQLPDPRRMALDVGCGAGHLSFALAPWFGQVVASDPLPSMLATVRDVAAQRGLSQITVLQARAETLPYPDASFDLVSSRYSAHHWWDVPAALREMRRVARPGGTLLMIDVLGYEVALVDTHLQAIELLRDPSHARDYSPSEWQTMIGNAGFELQEQASWPTRLQFGPWVERMHTPPERVAVIRHLLDSVSREVREGLAVEPDGSFTPRTGLFLARVPGA